MRWLLNLKTILVLLVVLTILVGIRADKKKEQTVKRDWRIASATIQQERAALIRSVGIDAEFRGSGAKQKMLVDPVVWSQLKYETKSEIANVACCYIHSLPSDWQGADEKELTIYDNRTNDHLATFSSQRGYSE